jgi:hypothetical protein
MKFLHAPFACCSDPAIVAVAAKGLRVSAVALDGDYLNEIFEGGEVGWIARVQRKVVCKRRRSDEQVDGTPPTGFPASLCYRRVDTPVRSSYGHINRKRFKCCLSALQSLLPPCSLERVRGCMRARGELSKRYRRNCQLDGKTLGIDLLELDHDGRVD